MERRRGHTVALSALDRVYLRRACELAERGRGNTSPNPSVGATTVLGSTTLGEGYHRVRGDAHAEVEALRDAVARGNDVRGATMYVSLEPCDHRGLTPPCTGALLDAGIARVVAGLRDPNPAAGGGDDTLLARGVSVTVASDAWSRTLVESFLRGVAHPDRPFVRDARATADAVLVGAGTVRIDDPELTVRPPSARRKPYVRVVACEDAPVPHDRAVFAQVEGYAPTIVLAPAALRERFAPLEAIADVMYVAAASGASVAKLDLVAALAALRLRGIASVLCEGGPTLAGRLLERELVDRIDWLIAPVLLTGPDAVRALGPATLERPLRFDAIERLGADLHCSAPLYEETSCSVA